jgi:hypothetical protein
MEKRVLIIGKSVMVDKVLRENSRRIAGGLLMVKEVVKKENGSDNKSARAADSKQHKPADSKQMQVEQHVNESDIL